MIPSYEMKIAFLKKHDIIKQLKKKTGITLEDLLKKKIFIAKPESHDTILRQYIDSANYGDLKGTDFDDSDLSPIPAEYWPISFSQQLSDQECQELKKNFFSEGRLVQDAALLVMAITESDSLTDSEKQSIDDRINKAIRWLYEAPQRQRNSSGGKTTAEIRKDEKQKRIDNIKEIWERLETEGKPPRNRCGIIAEKTGIKVDTVRDLVNEAGLRG